MSLSIKEVLSEDFDFKMVQSSFAQEKENFTSKCLTIKDGILKKKQLSSSNKNNYIWVSDDEVLSAYGSIPDDIYLMFIFDKQFIYDFSKKISSYSGCSWHLINKIGSWIARNDEISKIIVFNSCVSDLIKNHIIKNCFISMEDLIDSTKDKRVLFLPQDVQERVLELSNPEDSSIFIESSFEKVRIKAYQKLGPFKYLDKMIEDPTAEVRLYAINIISPKDSRLAKFVNDRSSRVFQIALQKIDSSLLPMMVGSSHMKKKHIKGILQERMISAQS